MIHRRIFQSWTERAGLSLLIVIVSTGLAFGAPHIVFVGDDSGTTRQTEKPEAGGLAFDAMKEKVIEEVAKLRGQLRFDDAILDVFTSSAGDSVWSDEIKNIQSERGLALKEAVRSRSRRCNDLHKTLEAVNDHLRFLEDAEEIWIIWVSGFFHSGSPCGNRKNLRYPSIKPEGVDFAAIHTQKPSITKVLLFGLHPAARKDWIKDFEPLLAWENAKAGRVFEVYTDIQTRAALARGLGD